MSIPTFGSKLFYICLFFPAYDTTTSPGFRGQPSSQEFARFLLSLSCLLYPRFWFIGFRQHNKRLEDRGV
jgi:hypothetical protein